MDFALVNATIQEIIRTTFANLNKTTKEITEICKNTVGRELAIQIDINTNCGIDEANAKASAIYAMANGLIKKMDTAQIKSYL